jgi:hypothetical protein
MPFVLTDMSGEEFLLQNEGEDYRERERTVRVKFRETGMDVVRVTSIPLPGNMIGNKQIFCSVLKV